MTAGAGRARRRRRLTARPLIVALVALAALVSPLEAGLLPGPASDAVGESAALAQSGTPEPSTVIVDADDCPTTRYWYDQANPFSYRPDPDDESRCVLRVPACPESPLGSGRLMKLSMPSAAVEAEFPGADASVEGYDRYPEFCEEQIVSSSPDYDACRAWTGYAVIDDGSLCRAFHPLGCVAGLHQHGSQTCRVVQRRTWTCDGDYRPGNTFRVCYLPTTHAEGAVPACETGAPDFGVFADADADADRACEVYVGQDVLRDADERSCSDYTTGPFPTDLLLRYPRIELGANTDNDHWCRFDGARLNPACHEPGASCASRLSLCLKRASRTGGCDLIIETIRCRGYQNAFEHNRVGADEVREAGCTPCVTLPFETPACDDGTAVPSDRDAQRYWAQRAILRCRMDFSGKRAVRPRLDSYMDPLAGRNVGDCPEEESATPELLCADPPTGSVEWSSNHLSKFAVVNSAVILRIVDLPFDFNNVTYMSYNPRPSDPSFTDPRVWPLTISTRPVPQYRDSNQLDRIPRQLSNVDPDRSYGNLFEMVATECRPWNPPLFNMEIEELWPGTGEGRRAIVELFGAESLDWWDDLPDPEKQRRTAERGTDTPRTAVECHERTHSCVWRPQRPGYYRIVGAGGWPMFINGTNRRWGARVFDPAREHFSSYREALDQFLGTSRGRDHLTYVLNNLTARRDLDHPASIGDVMFDYAGIHDVVGMEAGPPPRLRDPDLLDDMPVGEDWLYSEHARGLTGCPFSIDLRVDCSGGGVGGNYTETAPVGIIVHEVRTQTVAPVQNR